MKKRLLKKRQKRMLAAIGDAFKKLSAPSRLTGWVPIPSERMMKGFSK